MAESTAGKWHVNGEGKPGVCEAVKGGCPFRNTDGGTGLGHFSTEAEAVAAYAGYASALAKANGTDRLSKKTTTGDGAASAAPKTIKGWQDKLKKDATAMASSTYVIKAEDLRSFSNSGFIDPRTTGVREIFGVPIASANLGRKYLTYTNTNGAVDKIPLDNNISITRTESTDEANDAIRRLHRVNEIADESDVQKRKFVRGLANDVYAGLVKGSIDEHEVLRYNEARAKLDYFTGVKDRIEAGDTPEQAKLNAAADAINKCLKAPGSSSVDGADPIGAHAGRYSELAPEDRAGADPMGARAVAAAAMRDIYRDYDLSRDADWSIGADAEQDFEEDLRIISDRAIVYQQANRVSTDVLSGSSVDPRSVQALARANAEQAAIERIYKHRADGMEEGQRRSMFESAKDYVFANGVSTYDPYDRGTSTIINAREDGVVDATMNIAALVFSYAARAKK